MPNMNKFSGGSTELTGNAVASEVLSGKTFYSDNEEQKITGTMANMSKPHYEAVPHNGTGTNGWIGFNIPQEGYYKPSTYLWKYARDLDIGNAQTNQVLEGVYFTSNYGVKLMGTLKYPSYCQILHAQTGGSWDGRNFTISGDWKYIVASSSGAQQGGGGNATAGLGYSGTATQLIKTNTGGHANQVASCLMILKDVKSGTVIHLYGGYPYLDFVIGIS